MKTKRVGAEVRAIELEQQHLIARLERLEIVQRWQRP